MYGEAGYRLPTVCSDDGKYTFASASEAGGPNRPEALNTSFPESLRVRTIRCVEYFKLRKKEGWL
jgi:hypothetical protein